jgi:hypothetical protein
VLGRLMNEQSRQRVLYIMPQACCPFAKVLVKLHFRRVDVAELPATRPSAPGVSSRCRSLKSQLLIRKLAQSHLQAHYLLLPFGASIGSSSSGWNLALLLFVLPDSESHDFPERRADPMPTAAHLLSWIAPHKELGVKGREGQLATPS